MFPVLRNDTLAPFATAPINRLDNLFDRVFGNDGAVMDQAWTGAPMAMWEDEEFLCVEAERPGVPEQDVDITVHNGMLSIRAERRPEEGRRYLYNNRTYGRFERVLTLPEAVQIDNVEAMLKDGVLSIRLPKSPEAKPRKITLRSS